MEHEYKLYCPECDAYTTQFPQVAEATEPCVVCAEPISVKAAAYANSIIESLPDNVVPPEITPESDGRISIDWNLGKNRILSISIGEDYITFAAIIGLRKFHGQTELQHKLPKEVCELLPGYFTRDSRAKCPRS